MTKTTDELVNKIAPKNKQTPKGKGNKMNRVETIKSIVIAVLVTAIIAFVLGMKYSDSQHKAVESAVQTAKTQVPSK